VFCGSLRFRGSQVEKHCLNETRGYWKLKEEALDCTVWRTRVGRGNGPVVRQITE
jgi:hypothetical protein